MNKKLFPALKRVVRNFPKARVVVVGDLILDEFIWGTVSRISPEAPVPVVWMKKDNFMPGGACNVANNIRSLGGEVAVVGVTGLDDRAIVLKDELEQKGIDTSAIFADPDRKTTVKTRVVAHHQQVVRIDRETLGPVKGQLFERMLEATKERIRNSDAVIVEDYGKGVITPALLKEIVPYARKLKKVIAVDPKEEHLSHYRGVSLITPNTREAEQASGIAIEDTASLFRAGSKLVQKLRSAIVLITLGENGMCVFRPHARPVQIPTVAQEVFDVSGAGDTVIGAYTLALVSGADPVEAAHLANVAAGIVVGKLGTATVTGDELLDRIWDVSARQRRPA